MLSCEKEWPCSIRMQWQDVAMLMLFVRVFEVGIPRRQDAGWMNLRWWGKGGLTATSAPFLLVRVVGRRRTVSGRLHELLHKEFIEESRLLSSCSARNEPSILYYQFFLSFHFFCNYFDESNACIGFHSKKRFPLSTE